MVITEFQRRFRRRRSAVDNLVILETSIRDAFVGRKHLVSFFLEKAYDTTWRLGILLDLYKTGLRGHTMTTTMTIVYSLKNMTPYRV